MIYDTIILIATSYIAIQQYRMYKHMQTKGLEDAKALHAKHDFYNKLLQQLHETMVITRLISSKLDRAERPEPKLELKKPTKRV